MRLQDEDHKEPEPDVPRCFQMEGSLTISFKVGKGGQIMKSKAREG